MSCRSVLIDQVIRDRLHAPVARRSPDLEMR